MAFALDCSARLRGMALEAFEVELPRKFDGGLEVPVHPAEVEVNTPALFTCPISLDLMKDPVTLTTGMTYDRASIEQWLGNGNNVCPATNQVLVTQELIPNHTLRRLIQEWCVANRLTYGVERSSTVRQPMEPQHVRCLLNWVAQGLLIADSLKKLRKLAQEDERNRNCLLEAGAVPIIAGALGELGVNIRVDSERNGDLIEACEDGLDTIVLLPLTESDKKELVGSRPMAAVLGWLLSLGSKGAKINAAELLQSITVGVDNNLIQAAVGSTPGAVQGLVCLLEEILYPRAVHASLNCLLSICKASRKHRLAAIKADALGFLIQLLRKNTERAKTEHTFALLEVLVSCAEGREAVSNQALAIPMIVKSTVGISELATEHSVAALWAITSFSSNRSVLQTALQAGAFTKLAMILSSQSFSLRSKLKAREILKLLNRVGSFNPCRPTSRYDLKKCNVTATRTVVEVHF